MAKRKKIEPIAPGFEQEFEVATLKASLSLARDFVGTLQAGDTVALFGDLGAGKTAWVRAMVDELGFSGYVNSPTFTLLNIYQTSSYQVNHFDFYRIEHEEEALGIGFDEYLDDDGLCFIEWPENIIDLLPEKRYEIHLSMPDFLNKPEARHIRILKIE